MGDFITIFVLIKPKRNIMKRNIALGIVFCSSLFVWGQGENAAQTSSTPEALSQKVEKFGTAIPQEKVFLHIDNTCYFVGDTIWYKA
ncbi:secreted protein, partial [human gut metagenome]